jgi:hypothetical protein
MCGTILSRNSTNGLCPLGLEHVKLLQNESSFFISGNDVRGQASLTVQIRCNEQQGRQVFATEANSPFTIGMRNSNVMLLTALPLQEVELALTYFDGEFFMQNNTNTTIRTNEDPVNGTYRINTRNYADFEIEIGGAYKIGFIKFEKTTADEVGVPIPSNTEVSLVGMRLRAECDPKESALWNSQYCYMKDFPLSEEPVPIGRGTADSYEKSFFVPDCYVTISRVPSDPTSVKISRILWDEDTQSFHLYPTRKITGEFKQSVQRGRYFLPPTIPFVLQHEDIIHFGDKLRLHFETRCERRSVALPKLNLDIFQVQNQLEYARIKQNQIEFIPGRYVGTSTTAPKTIDDYDDSPMHLPFEL